MHVCMVTLLPSGHLYSVIDMCLNRMPRWHLAQDAILQVLC